MHTLISRSDTALIYQLGQSFFPPQYNSDYDCLELRSPKSARIYGHTQYYLELNFKIAPPRGHLCFFQLKNSLSYRGLRILNPIHLDITKDYDLILYNSSFVPYCLEQGSVLGTLIFIRNFVPEILIVNEYGT